MAVPCTMFLRPGYSRTRGRWRVCLKGNRTTASCMLSLYHVIYTANSLSVIGQDSAVCTELCILSPRTDSSTKIMTPWNKAAKQLSLSLSLMDGAPAPTQKSHQGRN